MTEEHDPVALWNTGGAAEPPPEPEPEPDPGHRPGWPAWYGPVAFVIALIGGSLVTIIALLVVSAGGVDLDEHDAVVNIAGTIVLDVALVAAALYLAAQIARPRPSQFGLRPTRFWRGVGWAALAFLIYFVFQIVYVSLLGTPEEQTTLEDLGAGDGGLAAVAVGVLVVAVAPVTEEFFFRGFFYGALRTRFTVAVAALLDGLMFGAIHFNTGVEAVAPLVVLGVAFCLAYEATGSIYPCIALHAFNNSIAFGGADDGDWTVALVVGLTVIASCIAVPGLTRRRLA